MKTRLSYKWFGAGVGIGLFLAFFVGCFLIPCTLSPIDCSPRDIAVAVISYPTLMAVGALTLLVPASWTNPIGVQILKKQTPKV